MKTRIGVAIVIVLCCCGLVLAATIERVGPGGLWSAVNQWDPNQLPASLDTAVHGADANNVMTFDDEVPPINREIGTFTAIAGDNRG